MVCSNHGPGRGDGESHALADGESEDSVDRRDFLKRSAGAGAGMGLLGEKLQEVTENGTIQFGSVGVRHRIEDDLDLEEVVDCAPPRWQLFDGELVFFRFYLNDDELARLADGQPVVFGRDLQALPAEEVSLAQQYHLPTGLGDDLQPSQGIPFEGSYTMPTPRIDVTGTAIDVEVAGGSERVSPGEEGSLELAPTTVGLRQRERRPTGEMTDDGESDPEIVTESTVVDATVVPEIRIRNYGELPFYTVDDRVEVN